MNQKERMHTTGKEEEFYQPIKEALESRMVDWTSNQLGRNTVGHFSNGHLEIMARKQFSNEPSTQKGGVPIQRKQSRPHQLSTRCQKKL